MFFLFNSSFIGSAGGIGRPGLSARFSGIPETTFLVCASKRITSTRLAKITSPNTIRGLGRQSTEIVDDETQ